MTTLEMKVLYEAGRSTTQIAEQAGINPQTVGNRLTKIGVKIRSSRRAIVVARSEGRAWQRFKFSYWRG